MIINQKRVSEIIQVVPEEMISFVKRKQISAIVNAAQPTLMGSNEPGVDQLIHNAIDAMQTDGRCFNDIIKIETDNGRNLGDNIIRCSRGKAVVTFGGNFCKYVMHVVGTEYDGLTISRGHSKKVTSLCTSSCIQKLESCYYHIIEAVIKQQDISEIAIPVVSSGNYGFPFETAVRVALSSIGNALMEWRKKDTELFNQSMIQKIYLCIYSSDPVEAGERYQAAAKIWNKYQKIFEDDEKTVVQNTLLAHLRYIREIAKYDRNRGYFAVARSFRFLLMVMRMMFLPVLMLKDLIGGCNWEKRRAVVEAIVFFKMFFPVIGLILIKIGEFSGQIAVFMMVVLVYFMADTITYLLSLIVLSDIQRPSANAIRSMIFLFLNYIEVSADMVVMNYLLNSGNVKISDAVQFGFLSASVSGPANSMNIFLQFLNSGIKFFFVTLAFGYFANHLHQRKFIS